MGGYGSGTRPDAKLMTAQTLRLDVRWLARTGLFRLTGSGWLPVRWTCNGRPAGAITVRYCAQRPAELVLSYRIQAADEAAGTEIREPIRLERTPCHYGGERLWWRCPGCGRRKAVLYGWAGWFRCVACHGLAYSSTREDELGGFGRRGDKLLAKLGAEPAWVLTWLGPPAKPKGMHATTYRRLCEEWEAVAAGATDVYAAGLRRWLARVESPPRRAPDRPRGRKRAAADPSEAGPA